LKASRAQIWFEGVGEWTWPGQTVAPVELLPPAWVPSTPPLTQSAGAVALEEAGARSRPARPLGLGTGALLSALAAACVVVAVNGPGEIERVLGSRASSVPAAEVGQVANSAAATAEASLPTLEPVSTDAAGSSIVSASYPSQTLGREGSFLVYLPPGYAAAATRYPVLYLLHGHNEYDSSFLQLGLQGTLDQLISSHTIRPMIAVMIQGGSGSNNWRDLEGLHYESYVVEVQKLIDRMLPTLADRGDRAIAGYSMGGYGSLNVALSNPQAFSVAESWCGFFNGLEGKLNADRRTIARLGLHAFLYGASADTIADPAENAPFASQLRAAGASAESAVFPGGHTFETFSSHLAQMLIYASKAMAEQQRPSTPAAPPAGAGR
jgi:enterochelin esterase-like enzyme